MQLPDGVDAAPRAPARILFLGRLGHAKGTYDLLQAVHLLLARHPDIELVLVGDGDAAAAHQAAQKLGLGAHVVLPGWVAGAAKAQLLANATVFVLPSYAEGLPMSLLEAMAAGLAVIASAVGGIPEIVTDGIEGRLVEPGDVPALAHALDRVLSDCAVRARMGRAGRAKAESAFASRLVVPQVEKIYRQLGASAPENPAPGAGWIGRGDLPR
jgi:glycosyltransferase involved in cell wall biosynthesis